MIHIATSIHQHQPFLFPSFSFLSIKKQTKSHLCTLVYTILALPTMEAFSLLKYWRGGGVAATSTGASATGVELLSSSHTTTSSTLTALPLTQNATDSGSDDGDDDGPFFDLEFTLPDDSEDAHQNPEPNHTSSSSDHHSQEEEEEEEEDDNIEVSEDVKEFNFTLSPSANDGSDPNLSLSPSDDLFFRGKLVQVDPSSFEPNTKPHSTASLFKSATKLRVFMSGLKKSKSNTDSVAPNPKLSETQIPESQKKQPDRKLFAVKFKVEEVPIMSLFTRDNSSKGNNNNKSQNQNQKQNQKQNQNPEDSPSSSSKEVMHKYLKMVKPLYIRVSRRYGDKLGFSGNLNSTTEGKAPPPPATAEKKQAPAKANGGAENAGTNGKSQKQGNLPAGLRVVCKHLGKSRSASSTVAAAPPSALPSSKRRDDSLLQQQDGIQSAILHCKRSFNDSRECQSSQLPRSVSDPLHEISRKCSKDKRL